MKARTRLLFVALATLVLLVGVAAAEGGGGDGGGIVELIRGLIEALQAILDTIGGGS